MSWEPIGQVAVELEYENEWSVAHFAFRMGEGGRLGCVDPFLANMLAKLLVKKRLCAEEGFESARSEYRTGRPPSLLIVSPLDSLEA